EERGAEASVGHEQYAVPRFLVLGEQVIGSAPGAGVECGLVLRSVVPPALLGTLFGERHAGVAALQNRAWAAAELRQLAPLGERHPDPRLQPRHLGERAGGLDRSRHAARIEHIVALT